MKLKFVKIAQPIIAVLFLFPSSTAFSQTEKEVKNMVESKQFVFVAEFALPMSGRSVALNSQYDLTISGDSAIAYLPYYGVAYSAPMNSDEAGIKFASAKSDFFSVVAKKDGWDISLTPKDISGSQKLSLHVSSNGRSTLQVTSVNRQPISFTGYIKKYESAKRGF